MPSFCACNKIKSKRAKTCWECYSSNRISTRSVCACGKTIKKDAESCDHCYNDNRDMQRRCVCGSRVESGTSCSKCNIVDTRLGKARTDGKVYINLAVDQSFKLRVLNYCDKKNLSITGMFTSLFNNIEAALMDSESRKLLLALADFHGQSPRSLVKELIEGERDRLGNWFSDRRELGLEKWDDEGTS